jgi:hypothetical protein
VSFSEKRLPQILELVRTPLVLKSSKAHRAVKLFVLLWFGIFIYSWLKEIELARNDQQLIRGFFAITAFNFGTVLHALLAAKFNIYFRNEGDTISEQNHLYSKKINIFPRFTNPLDTVITLCSVMLILAIMLTIAVSLIPLG